MTRKREIKGKHGRLRESFVLQMLRSAKAVMERREEENEELLKIITTSHSVWSLLLEKNVWGLGVLGGIYHYWLTPPSLAQPDIPPAVDINHDFSIIGLLSAMWGRMCSFHRF